MSEESEALRGVSEALVKIMLANLLATASEQALLDTLEASGVKAVGNIPIRDYFATQRREQQRRLLLKWEAADPQIAALIQQELSRHGDIWGS